MAIGDSDFIANSQLTNVGNRDMLLGATNWLIEQEELIGIGPKSIDTIKLSLTSAQLTQLRWFSFLALPLLFGVMAGAAVWRRRPAPRLSCQCASSEVENNRGPAAGRGGPGCLRLPV